MEIDDIFEMPEFRRLDLFLTDEMRKYAGDHLVERMTDVLEDESAARNWFYSPLQVLDFKRPYDYCKAGRANEIESIIGRIEHGVF